MGIQISAALIYGCYYSELPEEVLDEVNEMLDDGRLDYASPTYDAPRNEWVVGVEVNCESLTEREFEKARDDAMWKIPQILEDVELYYIVSPDVS